MMDQCNTRHHKNLLDEWRPWWNSCLSDSMRGKSQHGTKSAGWAPAERLDVKAFLKSACCRWESVKIRFSWFLEGYGLAVILVFHSWLRLRSISLNVAWKWIVVFHPEEVSFFASAVDGCAKHRSGRTQDCRNSLTGNDRLKIGSRSIHRIFNYCALGNTTASQILRTWNLKVVLKLEVWHRYLWE